MFSTAESDHSDSYSPLSPKLCFGCKKPIEDKFRLCVSPDLDWHISCLVCCECHLHMDENYTCFLKDGRTYCKKDYIRYVVLMRWSYCGLCKWSCGCFVCQLDTGYIYVQPLPSSILPSFSPSPDSAPPLIQPSPSTPPPSPQPLPSLHMELA